MSKAIKWIVALVILLIVLWVAFWVYAQIQLRDVVQSKISTINSTGQEHVSYDRITTSSSPFVISVTLINPSLTKAAQNGAPPIQISTASIGASLSLFHPLTIREYLTPRIDVKIGENTGVVTFGDISSVNILRPSVWWGNTSNPIIQSDAQISNMQILGSNGSLSLVTIGNIQSHEIIGPSTTTAAQMAGFVKLSMDDLQVAPAFTQMLRLPFGGEVKHLDMSFTLFGPLDAAAIDKALNQAPSDQHLKIAVQTIKSWAAAGGHILATLNLDVGPSTLTANMATAFDKQSQPNGTVNVTANHLDQFTAALEAAYPNLQDKLTQMQSNLAPYLSTTTQGGQVLNMHTVFGQTGVVINGKQTSTTPVTINWDTLENMRQPMPVLAPGDESGAAMSGSAPQP